MRNARDFAVTVLALGLAGVIAGVLWSLAAPRPPYVVTDQGPLLADPTTQALIAADGWFAIIAGAIGLACGAIGYSLSRRGRPLAVVLGLGAGGLLGSYVALLVGRAVNLGAVTVAASGTSTHLIAGPLGLTAQGVLLAWPVLAVGLFFALESIAGYRDSPLRRPFGGEDPYGPLSAYDISDR
ncbi:hypothetical protein [Streptosporangium lutulentum]|uniref:DUF2567 domain-containing protein n=1 Tax=Streptosporangium lutulentum TaxID=1461250 RepID=A0ABT9QEI7_9ACTN|nr:hypothetical protein [Streptosporangium lutulentum]MDP9845084.1 hypothetical protein [Streptosporangium lutulentum]